MKRPLKQTVSSKMRWHMSVREMPHQAGFSYPVFEWSFGEQDGIRGGELRAWPLQETLVFQDRRESEDKRFESVEEALKVIDEYRWGEPPFIDEVFQDTVSTHQKFPVEDMETAKQIFQELRQKWEGLVASS